MRNITVVDARMGRGKSSAAIRYMNQHKEAKCFLYITPYLTEVDRVCEQCDFKEPDKGLVSKSAQLKEMMRRRSNIASTHALFTLMDEEALDIARAQGYCLIIDESLPIIRGVPVSPSDKELLLRNRIISVNEEDGLVSWFKPEYEGAFGGYRQMSEEGVLYYHSDTFYGLMNPSKLLPFSEVYILTYLFCGQLMRAYLDFFGFTYDIVGVKQGESGYYFSDAPDAPPPTDYTKLIHILDAHKHGGDSRMNKIGEGRGVLSLNWFKKRGRTHPDVQTLRKNLDTFFRHRTKAAAGQRLWTTYKDMAPRLFGAQKRYAPDFLPLNARATNAHREANAVAYLVNRFVDPNFVKFFAARDIKLDSEQFALSEMLQFIWRSAIRDDKEIQLYIPSARMRKLLIDWMNEMKDCG